LVIVGELSVVLGLLRSELRCLRVVVWLLLLLRVDRALLSSSQGVSVLTDKLGLCLLFCLDLLFSVVGQITTRTIEFDRGAFVGALAVLVPVRNNVGRAFAPGRLLASGI
jgi:hypothetical protein